MSKKDIHVVPRGGGWAVRREGASRDSSHHARKTDAMEAARDTARLDRVEVVEHARNGRIQDSELLFASGETPFRMADLFAGLDNAIWSELGGAGGTITSLRRNLQREQLRDLIRMTLREGASVVDNGLGPVPVPLPVPATTLARASLLRLQGRIRAKLAGKTVLEATTKAHLQESLARIGQALSASMQRKVD